MTRIDKKETELNVQPFNNWIQQMAEIIKNNPQRANEITRIRAFEEKNDIYRRFLKCGASKEACDSAGFEKFHFVQNNKLNMMIQFAQEYASVLSGDKRRILNNDVTRSGNLLINGEHGVGKTYVALSIAKKLSEIKKKPRTYLTWDTKTQSYIEKPLYIDEYYEVAYVKSATLVSELTAKDYSGDGRKRACWNTYSKADFLIIDNCFGDGEYKEREEVKILSQVLDVRMDSNLPTCLITGIPSDSNGIFDWSQHLGTGLTNKVRMSSLPFDMTGCVDMRNPKIVNRMTMAS